MNKHHPILDFDPTREAIIEPTKEMENIGAPEHCVLCFHREVVEQISLKYQAKVVREFDWESGSHRLFQIEPRGQPVAFMQPGIGGPLSACLLEGCIAVGCRKFIACGGAGVLDSDIPPAHVIIPTKAVRDEGTSYHYLEPGLEAIPNAKAVRAVEEVLKSHSVPYSRGTTWTTDAPYRETAGLVKQRRAKGCITVEMEAAALFAVASFRDVPLAQMLYGGDDVSGEEWDQREWKSRTSIREQLFWLAVEACLKL
jgi:uridine phosphorylase